MKNLFLAASRIKKLIPILFTLLAAVSAHADEAPKNVTVFDNNEKLDEFLLNSKLPVMVMFYKYDLSTEDAIIEMEQMARNYEKTVNVAFVSIDHADKLYKEQGYTTYPAYLQVSSDGKELEMNKPVVPGYSHNGHRLLGRNGNLGEGKFGDVELNNVFQQTQDLAFAPKTLKKKEDQERALEYARLLPEKAAACRVKSAEMDLAKFELNFSVAADAEKKQAQLDKENERLFDLVNTDLRLKLVTWFKDEKAISESALQLPRELVNKANQLNCNTPINTLQTMRTQMKKSILESDVLQFSTQSDAYIKAALRVNACIERTEKEILERDQHLKPFELRKFLVTTSEAYFYDHCSQVIADYVAMQKNNAEPESNNASTNQTGQAAK